MNDVSGTKDDDRGYTSSVRAALANPIIRVLFAIFGVIGVVLLVDKIARLPPDEMGWLSINGLIGSAFLTAVAFVFAIAPSFRRAKSTRE
jgi:hypothetical protein